MSLPKVCIHDRVEITKNRMGTIAFIGFTYFALEPMYGIILDEAVGRNNGRVKNRQYFICDTNHGIFVTRNKILRVIDRKFREFHNRIAICDNVMTELYGPGNVKFVGILNCSPLNTHKYSGIWYGISLTTALNAKQIKLIQQRQLRHNKSSPTKKRMSAISAASYYNDDDNKTSHFQTCSVFKPFNNTNDYVSWQTFDGKYENVAYFYCKKYQGLFARQQQLILMEEEKPRYIPPKPISSKKKKSKKKKLTKIGKVKENEVMAISLLSSSTTKTKRKKSSKPNKKKSVPLKSKSRSRSAHQARKKKKSSNKNIKFGTMIRIPSFSESSVSTKKGTPKKSKKPLKIKNKKIMNGKNNKKKSIINNNKTNIKTIMVRDPDDVLLFDDYPDFKRLHLELQNSISNRNNSNRLVSNNSNRNSNTNQLSLGNIVTISNISNRSNGVISNASHSNSSLHSDFLGTLGRNNSYICQPSLPLSNTNSADSNVSFAVSEEDGLSQCDELENEDENENENEHEHKQKYNNKMKPAAIIIYNDRNHEMNKSINIDCNPSDLITDTSIINELDENENGPLTTIINDDDDDDIDSNPFASPTTANIQELIKKNQIQSLNEEDDEDENDANLITVVDYNEEEENEEEEEEEDIDLIILADLQDDELHIDTSQTIEGLDEHGNIIEPEQGEYDEYIDIDDDDDDDDDDDEGYNKYNNNDQSAFSKTGLDILVNIASFMLPAMQWKLLLISKDWNNSLKNKLPIINNSCYNIDNKYFTKYYSKCLTKSTANQHSFLFKENGINIANTFNLGNNYWNLFYLEDCKLMSEIKEYIDVKQEYISHIKSRSLMGGMMASLSKSQKHVNLEKKYKQIVLKKDKTELFSKLYHWQYLQYFLKYQSKISKMYSDIGSVSDHNNLGYKLRNISILTLSHIYDTAKGIGKFIGIILGSKYCRIKYISINGSALKSKDINTMCKYIQNSNCKNNNLFELVLKNNDIDDKCIVKLLKTIGSNLISLCHLDLSHNLLSNKACYSFAKFFNKYSIKIPKGGHYYLAINNPNDYEYNISNPSSMGSMHSLHSHSSGSDSFGALRLHRHGTGGSFAMNHDDEPSDFLFDDYCNKNNNKKTINNQSINITDQHHLHLLSLFNQQQITKKAEEYKAMDLYHHHVHNEYHHEYHHEYDININNNDDNIIDPNKCTSLCQVNIKKCKNIGGDGIAALIAMFVNPLKSKIRFRITKGNKQKYNHNHGVSFYNNKENKGHSKILTHSNWQNISKYYSIRDEVIIKWEKILKTRIYDNYHKLKVAIPQLPPLPQLPSTMSSDSNISNISNPSDDDINGPMRILCAPQNNSNTSMASNNNNNNNNNNNDQNNEQNMNRPRFINNLLSNKFSNHSNTSNQWEFDDSEDLTYSHSKSSNTINCMNYTSASLSSHIVINQSIELNTTSSWYCNQCQTSNLNVFHTCTHCGNQRIVKRNKNELLFEDDDDHHHIPHHLF